MHFRMAHTDGNPVQMFAGIESSEFECLRLHPYCLKGLAEANGIEHLCGIRAHLNPRANLPQGMRLLIDPYCMPSPQKAGSSSQPTDASTDNGDVHAALL
jgi:hypothetical protein